MLTDINEQGLQQTKEEVHARYPEIKIETCKMNVTDEESIMSAHRAAVELFGRIDYAVNNAGTPGFMKPSTESSFADFKFGIDINLFGVWMGQREQLKQMTAQKPDEKSFLASLLEKTADSSSGAQEVRLLISLPSMPYHRQEYYILLRG